MTACFATPMVDLTWSACPSVDAIPAGAMAGGIDELASPSPPLAPRSCDGADCSAASSFPPRRPLLGLAGGPALPLPLPAKLRMQLLLPDPTPGAAPGEGRSTLAAALPVLL